MDKNRIRFVFENEGFGISGQALELLSKIEGSEDVENILNQLKSRKLIVAGGDVIKYLLTGKISDTVVNSSDVGGVKK